MSDVIRLNKKTKDFINECLEGLLALYGDDKAMCSLIENFDDNSLLQLICEYALNSIYDLPKE